MKKAVKTSPEFLALTLRWVSEVPFRFAAWALAPSQRQQQPLTVWIAMVMLLPLWLPESLERQSAVERHARFLVRYDYPFPYPPR